MLDLATCRVNDKKGPRGAGWEENFIAHGADAAEQRWKDTVEDDLPDAFALIDAGAVELPDREADLVRDRIALHWARSRPILSATQRILAERRDAHVRQWDRPDVLDALFHEAKGIFSAGQQARQIARQMLVDGPPELRDGRYFAERVPHFFEQARARFSNVSIQIVDAPAGWEYVLGDAPVLTLRRDRGGAGPHQGVALGDAELIIMPLGPRVAVSLDAHRAGRGTVTTAQVPMVNEALVAAAEQQVIYRPGSPVERAVRRWAAARPPAAPPLPAGARA